MINKRKKTHTHTHTRKIFNKIEKTKEHSKFVRIVAFVCLLYNGYIYMYIKRKSGLKSKRFASSCLFSLFSCSSNPVFVSTTTTSSTRLSPRFQRHSCPSPRAYRRPSYTFVCHVINKYWLAKWFYIFDTTYPHFFEIVAARPLGRTQTIDENDEKYAQKQAEYDRDDDEQG